MQNQRLPSKNTSGFRGVSRFSKGLRWRAAIGKRNKIYLGCFRTAEEAARAYDAAARKLYGDAAAVNFPDVLLIADKYQISVPPPFVPGSEFAGVITELGNRVEGFAVGDRVTGTGQTASQGAT